MLAPVRAHVVRPGPAERAAEPEAQRRNRHGVGKTRHVHAGAPAAVARREDRAHAKAAHVPDVHWRAVESARHAPKLKSSRLRRPALRSLASARPAHGGGVLRWGGVEPFCYVWVITEASDVEAEGCLVWRGQIFAAAKLSSDCLYNLFAFGIRLHPPLLGGSCFCIGQAQAVFALGQLFRFVR